MNLTVRYLGHFCSLSSITRMQLLRSTLRPGQMSDIAQSTNPSVWAAYEGQSFAGWAILTPRVRRRRRWFQVFVQHRQRGKGVAEALYARALRASRVMHSGMRVTMHENKSEKFYQKMVRKYGAQGVFPEFP